MFKVIGKGALILVAGVLIGAVLLWVSYLLPLTEQNTHVKESVRMLDQEGWYPTAPLMHKDETHHVLEEINIGGFLDNFTDSIMITTAARKTDDGALHQAMSMNDYSYYWHGYVVLLRPLLFLLNYADIRTINQLLQMLLVFSLAYILYRRKGVPWAALALTVYGLLMPMAVSQALQYSWVFYIGMIGSLIIVIFRDWLAEKQRIYFFFLILGMLTSYMDLLTYPLFTWGIPMIWWIVTGSDRETDKKQLLSVILCGIAWICGYGGLWIGKWLIGGAILQQSIWTKGWAEVQYRAGVAPDSAGQDVAHWVVILESISFFRSIQGVLLLGGWVLWWGCRIIRNCRSKYTGKTLALLLISLSPIAWYVVLHDHSLIHSVYTYRTCVVGLTALLAIMIGSVSEVGEIGALQCRKGNRIFSVIIVLTAIFVSQNIKEETFSHNGNMDSVQLELKENMELIQTFVPSHSLVPAINVLLYSEAEQSGEIEIMLWEGDQVRWEHTVPAGEALGGVFYELPIELKLRRNTTYQISISGRNLEGGQVAVGVTNSGLHPLAELSSLQVGNQGYDAQLICGFRYRHRAGLRTLMLAAELQVLLYWSIYLLGGKFCRRTGKPA